MKVKDAMHNGVTWVEPGTSLQEAAKLMRDEDVGALPVGENDRLIGMITDRDIACRAVAEGADPAKATVREAMSEGIVYCREEQDLDSVLEEMGRKAIRRLPVINDDKRMTGMLGLGDISAKAAQSEAGEVLHKLAAAHA